jgi:hypothetical protein
VRGRKTETTLNPVCLSYGLILYFCNALGGSDATKIYTNVFMQILRHLLLVMVALATLASCSSSKKTPKRTGRVIIIEDSKNVRVSNGRKDNGLHKGWYKNPNNPHHPRTTNPGHTKHKGGAKGKTVVVQSHVAPAQKGNSKGNGNSKGKGGGNGKGKK